MSIPVLANVHKIFGVFTSIHHKYIKFLIISLVFSLIYGYNKYHSHRKEDEPIVPPDKKATLQDVARLANVSPASASMILQKKPGVSFSPETVSRVFAAAEQLGYRKSNVTSHFIRPTIAVIFAQITSLYQTYVVQSIDQKANEVGMDTVLFETHNSKEQLARILQSIYRLGFTGVILTLSPNDEVLGDVLELARKIPTVIIDNYNKDLPLDSVKIDTYQCGTLAMQHLLDLGHRDIAFIEIDRSKISGVPTLRQRAAQAVIDSCANAKMTIYAQPGPNVLRVGSFIETRQMARQMAEEALKNPHHTAFLCLTDYCAYGVMDTLAAHHLRIPEDYSVCACDNIFPSDLPGVSLTTVDRHPVEVGASSFELLYQRISSQAPTSGDRTTRVGLRSHLIVRSSTAAPRKT